MSPSRVFAIWTNTILQSLEIATQSTSLALGPPPVARLLAVLYTAAFEAWAPYTPTAKGPINGAALRRPAAQHTNPKKAEAVSFAFYRSGLAMFSANPEQDPPVTDASVLKIFNATMAKLGYDPAGPASATSPAGIGTRAAKQVLASRVGDQSNQANGYADTTDYAGTKQVNKTPAVPFRPSSRSEVIDPSRWQALTYFDPASERTRTPGFITPQWGTVKPFALTSGDQFRPKPPAAWPSQAFVDQAKHVIEIQRNLTIRQKVIAEFWADGPKSWLPPGHWCALALFVSERGDASTNNKPYGIDRDAKMFFALANAIFDASIATWEAKLYYDYVRPITAIRWLFQGHVIKGWRGAGRGVGRIAGETWTPFQRSTFPTPPFPEYTSGHSAFSMAAATVLKLFTGSDRFGGVYIQSTALAAEPDASKLPVVLEWPTFTEAAIEAGESRMFGGIHFHEGNAEGLEMGRKVGELAWTKAQGYF